MIREEITCKLSQKVDKKLASKGFSTERDLQLKEVLDLDFSENRARDWSNLVSAHKFSQRPCFWEIENKTLIKKKIETYDTFKGAQNESLKQFGLTKRFVTQVCMSRCGNFGILGFDDGLIIKIMMQSGSFKKHYSNPTVHKDQSIQGLYVDILNHDLVSCDATSLAKWDFYSGALTSTIEIPKEILFIKGDPSANLLLVAQKKNNIIKLLEVSTWKLVRSFKGHKKPLLDFFL